jgi:hypothetical protein
MEDEFEAHYIQRGNVVVAVNGILLSAPFTVKTIHRGIVFIYLKDTKGSEHSFMLDSNVRIDYNAN